MTNCITIDRTAEIVNLHNEITGILKISLDKAIRIGELLTEQKETLAHGQFTGWIKENLPFTDRTARNYMRFYENRELLKTENISDLTSAQKLLAPVTLTDTEHKHIESKLKQFRDDIEKLTKLKTDDDKAMQVCEYAKMIRKLKKFGANMAENCPDNKFWWSPWENSDLSIGRLIYTCNNELNSLLAPTKSGSLIGFAPTLPEHLAIFENSLRNIFTIKLLSEKEYMESLNSEQRSHFNELFEKHSLNSEQTDNDFLNFYSITVFHTKLKSNNLPSEYSDDSFYPIVIAPVRFDRIFENLNEQVDLSNIKEIFYNKDAVSKKIESEVIETSNNSNIKSLPVKIA